MAFLTGVDVDVKADVLNGVEVDVKADVLNGINVDVKADVYGEGGDFGDAIINLKNGREGKDVLPSISEEGVALEHIKYFFPSNINICRYKRKRTCG